MRHFWKGICLFAAVLLCFGATLHPFHVSRMEVAYKATEHTLQMSMHLFIDDLEDGLRRRGQDKLQLGTPKEVATANSIIETYLRQTIQVKVNGKTVSWHWIGKENTKDMSAIWCYFEVSGIKNMKELSITNSTLTELFADQQNMVQLTLPNGKTGFFILERGHITDVVKI